MGRPLHAASLRSWQRAENRWGQHPECPVEVLADGAQVWRVPPGSTVVASDVRYRNPREVKLLDPQPGYHDTPSWLLWVRESNGVAYTVAWTRLRRIDYTPAPAREEVPAATRAHG